MMCIGFREDTAIEGSFWRCRNGSPVGQVVPETIFVLEPGIGVCDGALVAINPTTINANKRGIQRSVRVSLDQSA